MSVIPASIASFLVACTMLLALRPFAEVVGLIDRPGGRKTHHGDVPVVGGLAMFSGLLVAAVGLPNVGGVGASAAVAMVYGTGYIVGDLGDLLGWRQLSLGWFALPFTVISIVALINAFNMLDGLDGLAGSAGLVALAGLMAVSSIGGSPGTLVIAASMLGAVAAFLMFNLPTHLNRPVRTFMGDAGSTLLGFVLAGLALALVQPTSISLDPIVVLWLMPIPIFELFSSTARRIMRGMSPAQADTGHYHHRLIKAGLSVRAICALYFAVSAASCAFGVWAYQAQLSEPHLFVGFCLAFMGWQLFVRQVPGFVAALPVWFRRPDLTRGH
jgi:UDP-GlcNAc:undecaprenyl-phosphate GlcNAc-1-phosphate transferase